MSKTIWKIKTKKPLIFSDLRRVIRLQENKNEKTVFRGGLPMKILRITAQGLPLFKKDLDQRKKDRANAERKVKKAMDKLITRKQPVYWESA